VDVSELVFQVLESVRDREVVPLGSAFPSPMLFPLGRLARCLSAGARQMDPWSTLDDLPPGRLRAIEIPTLPGEGIDVGALSRILDRHAVRACWFMTNFQNPLGALMPEDTKKELVKLLERHSVPLIEDDVYAELYFGRRPKPAKAFDRSGLVLHCSSFSKCLAPGYRIGWVAAGRFATALDILRTAASLA
jgi:DNA-binding transcriptional MocR family regulator